MENDKFQEKEIKFSFSPIWQENTLKSFYYNEHTHTKPG